MRHCFKVIAKTEVVTKSIQVAAQASQEQVCLHTKTIFHSVRSTFWVFIICRPWTNAQHKECVVDNGTLWKQEQVEKLEFIFLFVFSLIMYTEIYSIRKKLKPKLALLLILRPCLTILCASFLDSTIWFFSGKVN